MFDYLLTSIVRTFAYALVPFTAKNIEPRWAFTCYFAIIFISTAIASKIYKSQPKTAIYFLIPFQTFFFTIIGALYRQLAISSGLTEKIIELLLNSLVFISSILAEKFFQYKPKNIIGKIVLPIMIFASPIFISIPILFVVVITKALLSK